MRRYHPPPYLGQQLENVERRIKVASEDVQQGDAHLGVHRNPFCGHELHHGEQAVGPPRTSIALKDVSEDGRIGLKMAGLQKRQVGD